MAAVLACGRGAVLSHRSAARLHGLRPHAGAIELTAPTARGVRRLDGLRVRRSGDLPPGEVTRERAIPATTVERTLLDLAAIVGAPHLRRAVERAEQLDVFDLQALRRVLAAHPRRPGAPALRALLDDLHAHGTIRTRSDVEAAMLQLCLDHDLPRPDVNRWDGAMEVDFRWPARDLAIEVDGWSTHRSRAAFERDRERSQILTLDGWRLVRFSARQIERDPARVAERLAGLLRGGA